MVVSRNRAAIAWGHFEFDRIRKEQMEETRTFIEMLSILGNLVQRRLQK